MLAFACQTCRWHQEEGKPCGRPCSGPVRGGSFPCRVSDIDLHRHCFVCGDPPVAMLQAQAPSSALFGVCAKHLEWIQSLGAERLDRPETFLVKK
jgi:hypothetical protein